MDLAHGIHCLETRVRYPISRVPSKNLIAEQYMIMKDLTPRLFDNERPDPKTLVTPRLLQKSITGCPRVARVVPRGWKVGRLSRNSLGWLAEQRVNALLLDER